MKINGEVLDTNYEEILVIPKFGKDLVFKARAVLDFSEFDQLCPEPVPMYKVDKKTGEQEIDYKHKEYSKSLAMYNQKHFAYLFIKSLSATDDLEWDTVEIARPDTWVNYQTELLSSGFSQLEINKLIQLVLNANSINEERIDKATKSFLAGREKEVA